MNYIKQLQEEIEQLKANAECVRLEVQRFRTHLDSDKFMGTEWVCADHFGCGLTYTETADKLCPKCSSPLTQNRKDWIATADVVERLTNIAQWLG